MTTWLEDLLDEYPTNRTDSAIARLLRVYSGESDEVMRMAADAYMQAGKFFPKIADLQPFVKAAQERERGDWNRPPAITYPDDFMFDWEVARGSMQPLAEIGTELKVAAMLLRSNERFKELVQARPKTAVMVAA